MQMQSGKCQHANIFFRQLARHMLEIEVIMIGDDRLRIPGFILQKDQDIELRKISFFNRCQGRVDEPRVVENKILSNHRTALRNTGRNQTIC